MNGVPPSTAWMSRPRWRKGATRIPSSKQCIRLDVKKKLREKYQKTQMTIPSFECIKSPIEQGLLQVVQNATEKLFIAAPYISQYGVAVILKNAKVNDIWLLTNLSIENLTSSALDAEALLKLWGSCKLKVSSLGRLHAKVYIADENIALVTSANLTRGGLKDNYEYGVVLKDRPAVSSILKDISGYFELGNIFEQISLDGLITDINQIRALRRQFEASTQGKKIRREISEKQNALNEKMLFNRIRDGRTINSIFSDTIIYLLKNRGPLSTQEVHLLIQNIHADICDDSIDRVINGQHFGKKWKHVVRNSQQYLKSIGKIYLRDGKWCLTE
jgi:HKD family nuclease